MTATLPLSNGMVVLLSGEDLSRAHEVGKWFAVLKSGNHYVCRSFGRDRRVYLHRWILDAPNWTQVDHINGNTLDNRRENLRAVTFAQNQRNRSRAQINSRTGVRGVHPFRDKYEASVRHHGQNIYLGLFSSIEEARDARQSWEIANWSSLDRYRAMIAAAPTGDAT